MAQRKRSVSLPVDLSERVDAAARAAGVTFSAWLVDAARRKLLIDDGRADVAAWLEENGGPPTEAERAAAKAFVDQILTD